MAAVKGQLTTGFAPRVNISRMAYSMQEIQKKKQVLHRNSLEPTPIITRKFLDIRKYDRERK